MLRRFGRTVLAGLAWMILAFAVHLLAIPLIAQPATIQGDKFDNKLATPPTTIPRFPDSRVSTVKSPAPGEQSGEDSCLLPPLSIVHSSVTGASNLKVSPKAKKDYLSACSAIHHQNWTEAEQHLRKAVEQYPMYAAAWVTLGQVMQSRQRKDEARSACTHATTVDPTYLPGQLCLTDIAAHDDDWEQVLKLSQRALELNPTSDPHAYVYAASAYLKLNRLADAEKSAMKAVEIDKENVEPRVHFLLAQIYEVKGDSAQELVQLREYLKFVSNPQDAAMVKKYIADVDAQATK
jgi:Tfp pilus assembly protein PilF